QHVEMGVGPQRELVAPIAEQSEPLGVAHHDVELVAVNDKVAPTVGADMDGVALDGDAAEMYPAIVAQGLVVIAGNEHEVGALAHLAQDLLQDVIMGLRPVDAAPYAPEVDDVADQIDARGIVAAKEIEEGLCLTGLGAQMQIRDEKRAITPHTRFMLHVVILRLRHDKARLKVILYQRCDIRRGRWLMAAA